MLGFYQIYILHSPNPGAVPGCLFKGGGGKLSSLALHRLWNSHKGGGGLRHIFFSTQKVCAKL